MKKAHHYYTLMFVPDDNSRTFSLRLPRTLLRTVVVSAAVGVAGLLVLLVAAGTISVKVHLVKALQQENDRLTEENARLVETLYMARKVDLLGNYLKKIALSTRKDLDLDKYERWLTGAEADLEQSLAGNPGKDEAEDNDSLAVSLPRTYFSDLPNIRPVDGWVTRHFFTSTEKGEPPHLGVDFAAASGQPIRSTAPGRVANVENDRYLGKLVTIRHSNGFSTRYGHCSQILVVAGETVTRGQTIATVGNTGRSSAPHLHYEILKDNKQVDPMKYIFTGAVQ